jgi:glyoxylate/hydroxypyruvate reductase A
MRVAVVVTNRISELVDRLRDELPGADVSAVLEGERLGDVDYVVGWRLDAGRLGEVPNLRAILVTGAGYDHLDLASFPAVPVVRLVDPAMADDIALYCLAWIVHFQRDFDRMRDAQRHRTWTTDLVDRFARDTTVGVLGTGAIGSVVAERCRQLGYATIGWSRSAYDRSLHDVLAGSDVVVNVLPLTPDTRRLVSGAQLAALDDGVLINVGRGATIDTDALIEALDGRLRAAVLDVFDHEPLPADSPLWSHPKVTLTPHVAGRTDPATAAPIIAANIRRVDAGDLPFPLVTR